MGRLRSPLMPGAGGPCNWGLGRAPPSCMPLGPATAWSGNHRAVGFSERSCSRSSPTRRQAVCSVCVLREKRATFVAAVVWAAGDSGILQKLQRIGDSYLAGGTHGWAATPSVCPFLPVCPPPCVREASRGDEEKEESILPRFQRATRACDDSTHL